MATRLTIPESTVTDGRAAAFIRLVRVDSFLLLAGFLFLRFTIERLIAVG